VFRADRTFSFTLDPIMSAMSTMAAQLAAMTKALQKTTASAEPPRPVQKQPARTQVAAAAITSAKGMTAAVAAALTARTASIVSAGAYGGGAAAAAASSGAASSSSAKSKKQQVLEFIAQNRNANTRKAYSSGWAGFARYLEKHHIAEDKVDEYDVADYLRVRVTEQGVAASTMGNDRAAIADHLKNTDRKHVVHADAVSSMMAVLRTQAAPSKPKQHMSKDLMRELVATHEARGPSGRPNAWLLERDIFLMLLMMMAFLREGEAVALTKADVEVKMLFVEGKMQPVLHIFIARSKTDQAKEGYLVLLGEDEKNPTCCPVRRYAKYVAAVKAAGMKSDVFFPTVADAAMCSTTPCGIVQRAVKQANADAEAGGFGVDRWGEPDSYGSHSLRRGGVTTARANGASMLDIQKHGRWKSLTVFSYVGTTAAEQLAVTKSFLGEAKAAEAGGGAGAGVAAGAAAAAAAAGVQDEMPSQQAHSLRAAAAGAGGTAKRKPAAAAAAAASGKGRGLKRSRESEGDDEEEADTEAHHVMDDEEDALFMAACAQGWREDEEERKAAGRRAPVRAAKEAAKKAVEKPKATKKKHS